jgi:hypothetical protein
MKTYRYLALLLLAMPGLGWAATPAPATEREVGYLMNYLKASSCQFNRNGSWYTAAQAVDHLDQKYQYLLRKNMVASAEDFIARAATESSMSGRAYQVKCPARPAEASGPWLRAALAAYRHGAQR